MYISFRSTFHIRFPFWYGSKNFQRQPQRAACFLSSVTWELLLCAKIQFIIRGWSIKVLWMSCLASPSFLPSDSPLDRQFFFEFLMLHYFDWKDILSVEITAGIAKLIKWENVLRQVDRFSFFLTPAEWMFLWSFFFSRFACGEMLKHIDQRIRVWTKCFEHGIPSRDDK